MQLVSYVYFIPWSLICLLVLPVFFGGIIRTLCAQDHFISRDNFTSSFLILICVLWKLQGSWLSACTSVTAGAPQESGHGSRGRGQGSGSDQGRTAGEMSV